MSALPSDHDILEHSGSVGGPKPASVGELRKPLTMSLPAVLQHLRVLEASGLVRSTKIGRVRSCRIEPEILRLAEDWIGGRRALWERRLDRLGEFLAEDASEQGS